MKLKLELTVILALVILLAPHGLHAQQTSRVIPFSNVKTTIAPSTTAQALTIQLWDAVAAGTLMYCENQTLDVDANQAIAFSFGAGTTVAPACPSNPPGLDPADFPSGASRFLDVVDSTTVASVLAGRLPLNATAFALSPGPPGPPGVVQTVTAGDSSVVTGGTPANPTVAVANGGITTAKLAAGAVGTTQIADGAVTSAHLASNAITHNATLSGDGTGSAPLAVSAPLSLSSTGRTIIASTNAAHTFTDSALYGLSLGDGGIGIIGEANLGNAWGVNGKSAGGVGVVGQSTGGIGVVGESITGLAGRFTGEVIVGHPAGEVLHLNSLGTSAGIGVVAPFSGSNFMIVGGSNGGTFVNSSGVGEIHFRHNNNGNDQMRITSFGEVVVADALHLASLGSTAGIGAVNPLSGSNYMIVGSNGGDTFVNSFGEGAIHFRHNNNENDQMDIFPDGTTAVRVLQILGGADLAERFEVSAPDVASAGTHKKRIEFGMIVSIDPERPGGLMVSSTAYDRRVAGVISGAGGVKTGMLMGQSGSMADGDQPVALVGRVYCWADASNGQIVPGDLLTTSNIPGHAMKVTDHKKAQGAIIGKAMTGLKEGIGLVLALVTLQ